MAKLTLQSLDQRLRTIEDQLSISRPLEQDRPAEKFNKRALVRRTNTKTHAR